MTGTIDVAALVEQGVKALTLLSSDVHCSVGTASFLAGWIHAARRELQSQADALAANETELDLLRSRVDGLLASLATMREALEPSGDTKAAYLGEFYMDIARMDEAGDGYTESIAVSWTTIKEIMAAIKARALGGSNAE